MQKKMRIQLFTEEGIQLTDRLVTQTPEFAVGPKETHKGPMRIEVTLTDNKDIEDFITYIQRLSSNMPMRVVGKRGRTPLGEVKLDSTKTREKDHETLISFIKENNQKAVLEFLRTLGYVLLTGEHLRLLDLQKTIQFTEKDEEKYVFMIKRTKKAKDPKSDRYDPYVVIAIALDKQRSKIKLFRVGEPALLLPCVPATDTLKKVSSKEVLKFPQFLQPDERLKFSIEHRKVLDDKDYKPSKFYTRWAPSIEVGIRM